MVATLSSIGQSDSKISLGVIVNPNYSYRKMVLLQPDSEIGIALYNRFEEQDKFKIGYSFGIAGCYAFTKRLRTELQINYRNLGSKIIQTDLVFGNQTDPRFGTIYVVDEDMPETIKIRYNLYYLSTSLKLTYIIIDKKTKLYSSIGIAPSVSLFGTNKAISTYSDGSKERGKSKQDYGFSDYTLLGANAEIGTEIPNEQPRSRASRYPLS